MVKHIYMCDKIFLWPSVNAVATIRFYIKIRPNNLYVDNGKGVASIEATSVKKKKKMDKHNTLRYNYKL